MLIVAWVIRRKMEKSNMWHLWQYLLWETPLWYCALCCVCAFFTREKLRVYQTLVFCFVLCCICAFFHQGKIASVYQTLVFCCALCLFVLSSPGENCQCLLYYVKNTRCPSAEIQIIRRQVSVFVVHIWFANGVLMLLHIIEHLLTEINETVKVFGLMINASKMSSGYSICRLLLIMPDQASPPSHPRQMSSSLPVLWCQLIMPLHHLILGSALQLCLYLDVYWTCLSTISSSAILFSSACVCTLMSSHVCVI